MTFEDVQIRQAVTAEEGQKVALAVLIAPDHRFNVRAAAPSCSQKLHSWSCCAGWSACASLG